MTGREAALLTIDMIRNHASLYKEDAYKKFRDRYADFKESIRFLYTGENEYHAQAAETIANMIRSHLESGDFDDKEGSTMSGNEAALEICKIVLAMSKSCNKECRTYINEGFLDLVKK